MRLRYDPFPLVFAKGDEMTKLPCLDLFGLGDSAQARHCLPELLKQQRADVSFPSRLDAEQWGMRETIRHTLLLLKVGPPATGIDVSSAVWFVLSHQNPNGGWRPFSAGISPALYTFPAAKVPTLSGTLDRKGLRGRVGAYAV